MITQQRSYNELLCYLTKEPTIAGFLIYRRGCLNLGVLLVHHIAMQLGVTMLIASISQ